MIISTGSCCLAWTLQWELLVIHDSSALSVIFPSLVSFSSQVKSHGIFQTDRDTSFFWTDFNKTFSLSRRAWKAGNWLTLLACYRMLQWLLCDVAQREDLHISAYSKCRFYHITEMCAFLGLAVFFFSSLMPPSHLFIFRFRQPFNLFVRANITGQRWTCISYAYATATKEVYFRPEKRRQFSLVYLPLQDLHRVIANL